MRFVRTLHMSSTCSELNGVLDKEYSGSEILYTYNLTLTRSSG
jgi:hypothetical protein